MEVASVTGAAELKVRVEMFLIEEAAMLDEWRLDDWHALFTDDCRYLVPNLSGDPYEPPDSTLYLIADDAHHLAERIKRLGKESAHSEYPRSRTKRLVSNVRVLADNGSDLEVQSAFVTFRSSHGVTDTYFGRHEYVLVPRGEAWTIREKRTILEMGALRPHGRLSIIA
jgi:p-cumate 2,3-dioxygenase beta subunit